MYNQKLELEEGFCDGCCYNNSPKPELRCSKVKCCYLVRDECILVDGVVTNLQK